MRKEQYNFSLYLVTDRNLSRPRSIEEVVKLAIEGGVTAVQLREKDSSTREFIEIAKRIKEITASSNIPLIINDRVDIALAVDADGVHLGQTDMPYHIARKIMGKNKIIGLSVENMEQATEAEELDVDYLGVSPIFTTPTKSELQTQWGLEGLSKLRQKTKHILVGIGGINASNAQSVIEAGADGIAVVSAICSASDPRKSASELREIVDKTKRKML